MFEFSCINSKAMAGRIFRENFWRNAPRHFLALGLSLLLLVLGLVVPGVRWAFWITLGLLAPVLLAFPLIHRQAQAYANDTLSIMVQISEDGVSTSSALHSLRLSWHAISGSYSTPSFLFLTSTIRPPLVLPLAQLTPEARAFIQSKAPAGSSRRA